MKTKKLIEQVEAMGFEVERFDDSFLIKQRGSTVASTGGKTLFDIDTNYHGFDLFTHQEKEELFNILVEYARTPIFQREDETKHFYRLEGFKNDMNYINFRKNKKTLFISGKYESVFFKSQFTQSDINQMTPEQQKLFEIAVKERVEE